MVFSIILSLLTAPAQAAELPSQVVAVGQAVGIEVQCQGLLVVGFPEDSPARESGLKRGDRILQVDGQQVTEPGELRSLLQDKRQVTLTAVRDGQEKSFLVALRQVGGMAMIGANVKTEMAGIGTITYYDPDTTAFGALGHGITDETTGALFPIRGGYLCRATVVGAEKGRAGTPGMLQGAFEVQEEIGGISANTACGIYGSLHTEPEGDLLPVVAREKVHCGPAEILCTVEGEQVERFNVEIQRVFPLDDGTGRNMMLKVTDPRLLEKTGGIVQGMSGSPILQEGNLVGAVTHVLVSDPTKGYGISIEDMLEASEAELAA